jgi:MFS superfamily sulfate permease-like transporter
MRKNLVASVLVFLVALPLCLGIAVASGVSPEKGIISGFIGGVVAGALSGAPLQVSGPANSLIVIVADAVAQIGLSGLGVAVFLAGVMQISAAAVGGGRLARLFPPAVTQGLMAAFAIMIFASQAHVLLDSKPSSGFLKNVAELPGSIFYAISTTLSGDIHWGAVFGITSLVSLFVMSKYQNKLPGFLKKLPPALFVVLVSTVISMITHVDMKRVHVPDSIIDDFVIPDFNLWLNSINLTVIEIALTIFVLASAESLLSAAGVDTLKPGHVTNYDRELMAQGFANLCCALLGALPVAGVIIRSTANVAAGATSRWSSILHGLWLLIMVGLFPFILDDVPLSILGAILVFSVIRLINPKSIALMAQSDKWAWPMYVIPLLTVLVVNPMAGVAVGVGLHLIRGRLPTRKIPDFASILANVRRQTRFTRGN